MNVRWSVWKLNCCRSEGQHPGFQNRALFSFRLTSLSELRMVHTVSADIPSLNCIGK